MRSKILTTAFMLLSFLLSILTLSALSVSAVEVYVSVDASATPSVIALNETTKVTINITSEGSPEIIFPVDVVLVMDCSGSMNRYGTIISGPEEVNLTTNYEKVGEFSLSEEANVEVMLQIPIDIYYYNKDKIYAYLKKKGGSWQSSVGWGYSTVRWDNIQPGTYEVYARLRYSNGERRRIFAVELPPKRIELAKDAACAFVDMLGDDDRAGVVKFHSRGWSYEPYCKLVQPLESNKNAVKNVIRNTLGASGGTPMGEGLDRALDHLESHHARENAVKAIIMLTDGWWNMGCNPIEQAYRAKSDGIPIYTIGWGGVNESALREIAEISGGEFYKAATGDDLREIYEEIAKKISNITAKNATLRVELSDKVEYAGNASIEPEINGRVLTWHLGTLLANQTKSISFDVKAKAKGVIPINTRNSTLTYEDFYGMMKEVDVPVVYVNVLNRAPVIEKIGWSSYTTCIYHNDTEKKYVFMANESEGLNERGTVVKLTIAARDPDGDPLSYSKDSNIGTLETNDFYWSPGYDFVRHPERRKNVTITFTVSDGELSDNATVTIIVNDVNRPPIFDEIEDKIVNEGETLNIVLNATDPDGDKLNFSSNVKFGRFDENIWNWTPDYDDAGVYYVEFTVSDGIGGIDNETVRITVKDVPSIHPPVAMFSVSNETPTTNQTVIFDASASYDPDGEIVAYRWDFGDGSIIEGNVVKVTHNYNKSGIYNVILEVEDDDGAKNRTTKEINVSSEYLFSVQKRVGKIVKELDNGSISTIREEFENNNISLSENASVTEEEEDEWVIKDGEGASEKEFIVKRERGNLSIYLNGAMIWISGNVTWNGNHTFEGIKNATTIGSPLTITATAYEIKNELDESVNVTAELHVDGVCLNKNTTKIEGNKQNGTVSVSATWIPMSSGVHFISLHVYDGPHWVGPTNDPTAKVEVFIEKVEQAE